MANINWQNLPSETTPINSTNLNVMSAGLLNVSNEADDTYRVNLLHCNNLFDINSMVELIGAYRAFGQGQIVQSASYNGLKIPVKSNATYTITINANYSNLTYWDNTFTRIGGEAFSHSGGSGTFTTPSGCFYITLAVQNNYTQIMLNEGSTSLPYEPFIQNQIVVDNEKYSDTLNVGQFDSRSRVNVLKSNNLLNVNDIYVANAVVQQDGRITGTNDFDIYKLYVKPSTKYTIKATYPRSGDMRIIDYNSSNTLISVLTTQNFSANETKTFTITTSSTASYIIFHLIKNNTNTMINEGDTALPYEPYVTPSIYVDNEEIYTKPEIVELLSDTTITASTSYTLNDAITNYKYIMVVLTSANLFQNSRREYIPVEQIKAYSTDYRIGISVFQTTSVYMFADLYFSSATQIYCNGKTQGSTGWSPHLKVYGIK